MNRIAIVLTIFTSLICVGCMRSNEKAFVQSAFFKGFSLDEFLAQNKSYLDCSEGGSGDGFSIHDLGSNAGPFRSNKSEDCSCRIKGHAATSFDEAFLISGLAADLEKAIVASGARIIKSGKQNSSSIYLEYASDDRNGRVEISVKRLGSDQYRFEANLDEAVR